MDFSCLSMLKELCLDNNPIVSMPHFVRSLPRLEQLSMENCEWVVSIEHPPRTLRVLSIKSSSSCLKDYKNSLRKIIFDPEMSPLNLLGASKRLSPSSFEVDGMIKIQPMASVEERVLRRLGWKHLEFTKERHLGTYTTRGSEGSQTQMYYEFGIFSTIYEGKGMPNWIRRRSKGSSISFTIPLSPKKCTNEEFAVAYKKRLNSPNSVIKGTGDMGWTTGQVNQELQINVGQPSPIYQVMTHFGTLDGTLLFKFSEIQL
ncbi:hypothetical protein M8C21_021850, partial [Ambrosia artemisiifolia]